jgi:pimeloyl-ACP methyl ester carboxylesterase
LAESSLSFKRPGDGRERVPSGSGLLDELRTDPVINRRYQFWVYSYPSGYPFPYSAMLLREELDRVDKTYPNHKKIVLIGHSMGGLVSRLMVTDAKLTFWDEFFGKPPEQVGMDPADKRLLEQALIFEHRPEVTRVIFISTPIAEAPSPPTGSGASASPSLSASCRPVTPLIRTKKEWRKWTGY